MASNKKQFNSNPALQFISGEPEPEPQTQKSTYKGKSETLEDRLAELRKLLPEGHDVAVVTEPRSKRLQLVITPTMHKLLRTAAEKAGISINEYVIRTIQARFDREDD